MSEKLTKKEKEVRAAEAKAFLRKVFRRKSTAFTVLTRVSSTGMCRHIKVLAVRGKEIVNVSWYAADLLGWKWSDETGSVVVAGCGMDMGFHTVYSMSNRLWDDGYAVNQRWV
jgi:hypothetical protein